MKKKYKSDIDVFSHIFVAMFVAVELLLTVAF